MDSTKQPKTKKHWRNYIFYEDEFITLLVGDVREIGPLLPKHVAQTCITSPPYLGLRDYGTSQWEGGSSSCNHIASELRRGVNLAKSVHNTRGGAKKCAEVGGIPYKNECRKCGAVRVDRQIGLEDSVEGFVETMVAVFADVKVALKKDGSLWLNLGDSFAGSWGAESHRETPATLSRNQINNHPKKASNTGAIREVGIKPKDLMLIPHTVAAALRGAGWWLRQAFPWPKRAAMPDSCDSRAANALEYVFHLQPSKDGFYDAEAVRVGMAASSIQRLQQDTASQTGSTRANAGGKTNGNMKAVGALRRVHAAGTDVPYLKHQQQRHGTAIVASRDRTNGNRNGEGGYLDNQPTGSRNFRNTELWFESVDAPHGLAFLGDDIIGIDCNPAGFAAEFCTACGRYYHDSKDRKEIIKETITIDGNEKEIKHCICGRTDAWLSHFATYPMKFAMSFIKCATSEAGECGVCGKAWLRVTEVTKAPRRSVDSGYAKNSSAKSHDQLSGQRWDEPDIRQMLGFASQCGCGAEPVPQTVLDPFAGAATTLIAAKKLGRRSIGIELNPDYARMAVERIKREANVPLDPPRRESNTPLFDMVEIEIQEVTP